MKKSVRALRMERHHKRFGTASLSLVSLMDIFTILVFFLLFNSSGVHQLPSSKAIELPESIAEELPKENLIIMVSATDIIVQGVKVAHVPDVLNSDEPVIANLKAKLLQKSLKLIIKPSIAGLIRVFSHIKPKLDSLMSCLKSTLI